MTEIYYGGNIPLKKGLQVRKRGTFMEHEIIHLKEYYPFLGDDGCDPTVEMYLPYNMSEMHRENAKRPCLVICPGGGYCGCSQREKEPIALNFLDLGFNIFVITYSCRPHRFPTQLREVAALMELIYENAEKWNCNTEKIAILGFSAGGHLAAHYSTSYDCDEVRAVFPKSKPVNASVLCYPVITADPKFAHNGSFNALLGTSERTPEEIEKFSCDRLVTAKTPPAFIWHTASDNAVPIYNSIFYAEALASYKIPFEMHIYPTGPHGLATADYLTNDLQPTAPSHAAEWIESAKKWFGVMEYFVEM